MALPYVVKAFKKLQEGFSMIPEKIFWAILSASDVLVQSPRGPSGLLRVFLNQRR